MSDTRTDTARDHDDRDLIENSEPAPSTATSSGGNLARDVASKDELAQVNDPDTRTKVVKQDAIDHNTASRAPKRPD